MLTLKFWVFIGATMVVFMPLKANILTYDLRDHASLSHNKGGLKNILALNTHDKNFIRQGWL